MKSELSGRVALVTGASRNIGRAIAVEMARRGAEVAVHVAQDKKSGQKTAAAVTAAGQRSMVALGDLSRPGDVKRVISEVVEVFGRLDIVVNNAAVRPEAPFDLLAYDEWRRVLAVCLDSVFLVSQSALPYLQNSDQAAIINLGGLTGHTGAARRAHVVTAKAGVIGLTKAMAHELAPGITVNCVSPGLIETERRGETSKRPHHHATRTNLAGRRGLPEEVAAAVAYLCSPGARYITGETLHVNGGAYLS